VGKVGFIRLVAAKGTINILGQQFKIGKRLKYQYVKATRYTKRQILKIYHKGRLVRQFSYKLSVELSRKAAGSLRPLYFLELQPFAHIFP
jgi:hypothetical protein